MGRVGDDGIGRRVLRELRAEGVSLHATVDESARTGLMLKETPTAGSTRVLYYRVGSAGSRLTVDDLDFGAIQAAGVLHVTGLTLALSDSAEQAVFAAIGAAVAARVPVSFDVNHRPSLWRDRDARAVYRRVAERATIVFAGAEEAELLGGPGTPDQLASAIAALGPQQAIVKLGDQGSVASIDGELLAAAAEPIAPLDTVGAGDASVAGYLVALLDGLRAAARLELGSRCGAFACLGPGAWESLPRPVDLAAFGSGDPVAR